MVVIGAIERQSVKILDANGTLLTVAMAGALDGDGTLDLDDVDDHGALIDYFFGRCQRIVIVERDGTAMEGTLDTRWRTNERAWWIGLSQLAATRALASMSAPEPAAAPTDAAVSEPLPEDVRVPAALAS